MQIHQKNTLGVIGGLGPLATAHFMELVIRMTRANRDQDHLDMIIYNMPSIPDRTAYILDQTKPDPLPEMIRLGKLLESQAGCIAIPCFTAHYFYDKLCEALQIPVINALQETASCLKAAGIHTAGIMATDGTVRSKLFQKELEAQGIRSVLPSDSAQQDVMSLIYEDIKQNRPGDMKRFHRVSEELRAQGAQVIILGCTELSMIKRDNPIGPGYLDAMEVLAAESIRRCCGSLIQQAQHLITQ